MSRIDDLITTLCPGGVPHKPMGEVGEFIRGSGLQKKDLREEGTPAIHYGQVHTHYGIWSTKTISFVEDDFGHRLRHAQPGDVILATTSEDDEAVGKATAWLGNESAVVSGDAFIYRHSLDPKYVSYFLNGQSFQDQKARYITGAKVRRISGASLAKVLIPVPPNEIQHEIVGILDKFTQLEAELEAELEARQKQYAYYSNLLLTFSKEVPSVSLGSLGVIFGGLTGKSKIDFSDGNARFASYKNIFNNISLDISADDFVKVGDCERQRSLKRGDILFTGSSESFEEVGMTSVVTDELTEPIYLNSFCIGFRPNDLLQLDPEFSKHLFRAPMIRKQIIRSANGVTRINLSRPRLAKIEVPTPKLEVQREIAGILDRFESLVNDLSSGLPAEITARRKQYEYYRDKLLTFDEVPA